MPKLRESGTRAATRAMREMVLGRAFRCKLGQANAPSCVRRLGLEHGLMIYARRFGDWFMLSPPLVTTKDEADEIAGRLERTLVDFTSAAARVDVRVSP